MFEAVRTTASPAAIWTICVVALGCLAFWLGAIAVADHYPFWRHWQAPDMPGPVLGGIDAAAGGRSVSPSRDAPAVFTEPLEAPAQRGTEAAAAGTPPAAGDAATAAAELPAQRTADADHPERSVTGNEG
jgi:hypothetical protein